MAADVQKRVFFAGEATNCDYFGTVHAAILSAGQPRRCPGLRLLLQGPQDLQGPQIDLETSQPKPPLHLSVLSPVGKEESKLVCLPRWKGSKQKGVEIFQNWQPWEHCCKEHGSTRKLVAPTVH
jgi:hypothetical protein